MAKTPISLLKDLSNLNEWNPEYKLTHASGPAHAPTFTYFAKVGDIEVTACASRKQAAKHAAAKLILEKLLTKEGGFEDGFDSEGVHIDLDYIKDLAVETAVAEVPVENPQVNSVSILQELCTKYELQVPSYETKEEVGLPHEKTFTMSCNVGCLEQIGTGKSKRIAKREAAELVLKELAKRGYPETENEEPNTTENDDAGDNSNEDKSKEKNDSEDETGKDKET